MPFKFEAMETISYCEIKFSGVTFTENFGPFEAGAVYDTVIMDMEDNLLYSRDVNDEIDEQCEFTLEAKYNFQE